MIVDLPARHRCVAERSAARDTGSMASRVLTLVVVVDESDADAAIDAANDASRQHPCRIIVVVPGNKRGARPARRPDPGRRRRRRVARSSCCGSTAPLAAHGRAVVTPLLLADSPIVAWWPGDGPSQAVARTRSARWRSAGSPTPPQSTSRPRTVLKRRAGGLRRRRHRPRLVADHAVARRCSPPPSTSRPTSRSPAHRRRRRADSPSRRPARRLARRRGCAARSPSPARATAAASSRCGSSGPAAPSTSCARTTATPPRCRSPASRTARIALPHRGDAECLADELRRLDPDEVYEDAL